MTPNNFDYLRLIADNVATLGRRFGTTSQETLPADLPLLARMLGDVALAAAREGASASPAPPRRWFARAKIMELNGDIHTRSLAMTQHPVEWAHSVTQRVAEGKQAVMLEQYAGVELLFFAELPEEVFQKFKIKEES